MALKIRYLNGPLAGKDLEIDDTHEEVKFGRGVNTDVSFPEDLTAVSREHFMLTREFGGGYKFAIDPEKPVFMNGRPLFHDQALPKDAEIQLGSLNGPRLKIERVEALGSNQLKTEIFKPQAEAAHAIQDAHKKSNRSLGLVAGISAVVAVLGIGGWLIAQNLQGDVATVKQDVITVQQQVTAINADIPAVRAELAKVSESTIDAAGIIAKNKESVYLVEQRLANGTVLGTATASVILLPDGTKALGTNAHVAEMYEEMKQDPTLADGKLVAVQSKAPDYTVVDIVSVKIHPGYAMWAKWVEDYNMRAAAFAAPQMDFGVPGYDVAILYVAEPDKLGPALTFASRETINGLKSGDPVIAIGFPAEGLVGTSLERPEATSQTGRITSLTTFYLQTGETAVNQLIQHSIPSAGGASGSAILNAKGEIVGFHNAGNIAQVMTENGARVGSAAMINFGQRADMMLDIMEGKEAEQAEEIKKQMAAADAQLNLPPEKQIAQIMDILAYVSGGKDKIVPAGEFVGVMETPLPEVGSPKNYVITLDITEPGRFAFITQSEDGRPVATAVMDNGLNPSNGIAPVNFQVWSFYEAGKPSFIVADYEALIGTAAADKASGKVTVKMYRLPLE
jgi:hypothetical protein